MKTTDSQFYVKTRQYSACAVITNSLPHIFSSYTMKTFHCSNYESATLHDLLTQETQKEGERQLIQLLTDYLRMSTYQARFKNTSEAPVLKKQKRNTGEEEKKEKEKKNTTPHAPCAE